MRFQFMRRWRWFCRDGAGDAGINRLDAPKVALVPASRSAEPYGLAVNNAPSFMTAFQRNA
jgi:hypothetical protein